MSVQAHLLWHKNLRKTNLAGQQINTITDKTLELRADLVLHTVLDPKEEPTDKLNKEKQL